MTEMLDEVQPTAGPVTARGEELISSSARFGAFTDAVVAIALTLLILPLMEAVPEQREPRPTVLSFLDEHQAQLTTFAISFVLIAMFWLMHHRVFRADTPGSGARTLVNFGWLLTIVLMPVTTALSGATESDRLMLTIYVGNLVLSSWLLHALTLLELRQRRRYHLVTPNRTILAAPLAMSILFTVILAVSVIAPQVGYWPLFGMILTGPLRGLLVRLGLRDDV